MALPSLPIPRRKGVNSPGPNMYLPPEIQNLTQSATDCGSSEISNHATTSCGQTWRPTHGIVFHESASRFQVGLRAMTSAAPDTEQTSFQNIEKEGVPTSCSKSTWALAELNKKEQPVESTCNPKEAGTNREQHGAFSQPTNSIPKSDGAFKMSEDLFYHAKSATTGSPESYWSHSLYRGPTKDGIEQRVKVHYCRSKNTSEQVLQRHFLGKKRIGFDLEWKPQAEYRTGVRQNVSLVQLACEDRVALIHVALFADEQIECPPTLKKILEDPEVTKIGVAIKADCTRFRKFLKAEPKSLFELSHLYKLIKYSELKDYKQINKRLVPLAQQVEEHLHLPLFKGEVRSSDWSQVIHMEQIVYAAADAYAGLQLFETMDYKRKALTPSPPCPYHIDENKPIRLADGVDIAADEMEETLQEEQSSTTRARQYQQVDIPKGAAEIVELDANFELLQENSVKVQEDIRTATSPRNSDSPIVLEANAQVNKYRNIHAQSQAGPSKLRAYFIWHYNPDLDVADIAALLRTVPLQTNTVAGYILEAVRLEELPFDKARLKALLQFLPQPVRNIYWPLVRTVRSEI